MKFKGEKFLSKEELKNKVKSWQKSASEREASGFRYEVARTDKNGPSVPGAQEKDSIESLHGVSFIRDIIPELIAKKRNAEKVKILDVGAGAALFTDEIRKSFPGKVEVFSTGIRKKTAKEYRKENVPTGENNLHPNDLKWRSILELRDFEEFDLIIDTFGEYFYSDMSSVPDDRRRIITEYLTSVIKKLKPGGVASLSPRMISKYTNQGYADRPFLDSLESQYRVKISQIEPHSLRIEKMEVQN
jgi:SAM-dependent methyltransferase